MRVAHTHPATWRGRIQPGVIDSLHVQAVQVMRAVTDNVPGLWDRLSQSAHALYTRIQKARSLTQQPSALARLQEEIVGMHSNGVGAAKLNLIPVALTNLIAQLDGPQPITAQRVLEVMHEANLAIGEETIAESKLALRPDRELTLGALEEHREKTFVAIGTLHLQLRCLDQQIAQKKADRPMRVIRGGQA